mmetsp:Transcript_2543/g.5296  ORF Transcript_2543/g.5296 Transcript_2543/m.5296 type:complete len:205 (-) Transcript_2543:385-999(-)
MSAFSFRRFLMVKASVRMFFPFSSFSILAAANSSRSFSYSRLSDFFSNLNFFKSTSLERITTCSLFCSSSNCLSFSVNVSSISFSSNTCPGLFPTAESASETTLSLSSSLLSCCCCTRTDRSLSLAFSLYFLALSFWALISSCKLWTFLGISAICIKFPLALSACLKLARLSFSLRSSSLLSSYSFSSSSFRAFAIASTPLIYS